MKSPSTLLIPALVSVLLGSAGAADFPVVDFGAIGDGSTDDAPAVRKALAAAIEAGSGAKLVFEKKVYRFARQPGDAILALDGATGITLEGNGAEIIGNPWNPFLSIRNSTNITMRGFVLDCDPVSFTQGDIIEISPGDGSFLWRIHEGYANPVELEEQLEKKAWQRVGFTLDPKERRIKPGPVDLIENITEVDRAGRLLRIDLEADSFTHIAAGDHFVFGLHHGGHGALINVEQSSDIRLEDYTIHGGKFGMNHTFLDNQGRVHVKGAKIAFRPGSKHLVTSIKDGFHVKHNRIGPIIEDCSLEGMMDDSINISVCPYWVKKDLGDNRYLIAEVQFSPRVGNELMAYTPVPGTITRGLKVLAVEPQENPKGRRGKWNIITLDQPIPGLALHQGGNLFPAGPDKLHFTGLYNLDACGKDYIVRNNHFLPQRRHALLARCPGGLFEGNTVDGIGGSGVWLGNEVGSFYEGPFPADTAIRNNRFRSTGRNSIQIGMHGRGARAKNITIENNTFSGWAGAAMSLSNLQGGVIRGNTLEAGHGDAKGIVPVVLRHSSDIRIRENTIHDERSHLTAAFDLSTEVDADSLLMSDNQVTLGAGCPRLMQIIPPPSIQPRGQAARPLRAAEDTGAYLRASHGETPGRENGPIWTLHPLWKNGLKGGVLLELPADLTGAEGIRFATRSATGLGDGVVLTIEWKPLSAPDSDYRTCYEGTILQKEWATGAAKIETDESHVLLRFRFDCGPADNTGYDSVQIANLDTFTKNDGVLHIADFGARGDGVHNDGPAIRKAFEAAQADGIPSTVTFENKTYRLGDNPTAWHYFQLEGHEHLTIEGKGATLLTSDRNLAFHFDGGRDITVRGLTLDTIKPTFTQGEVLAVNPAGSIDVKIMDGYPEPPVEAFLTANKHRAHGGGGRHMIVFEKGGQARNTSMDNDHLYIRNITRVSPGVFRFHVKEDYMPRMKGMAVENWVSYGFNKVNLPATEKATKDKSASIYAQIAADRVEHMTIEDIDIFGSLNGGIRVSDMPGDVTIRKVRIIRKPGTRNLLSTISDALHLMNIRGKLILENCEIEAPGDDCLNVGTLLERIVKISKDDPRSMSLRTTDNRYYHYLIRTGDRLQFLDTKNKRELAIATVEKVNFDLHSRIHRVVLDRVVPNIDPASVLVLNLNQMTSSSVLRNNTMRPYMRN
ncbi:MAG: right-handed parallel beta-helix repeat-containing protein, partial [Haloferula sp.]